MIRKIVVCKFGRQLIWLQDCELGRGLPSGGVEALRGLEECFIIVYSKFLDLSIKCNVANIVSLGVQKKYKFLLQGFGLNSMKVDSGNVI